MKKAVLYTLLIETSPQALPLGAACIASSLKNNPKTKGRLSVILKENSKEDKAFSEENAGFLIADEILNEKPDFVLFSIFVWNRKEIESAAKIIKKKNPSVIVIAGGPEVTANPYSFDVFDYALSGQGEKIVPVLISDLLENRKPSENVLFGKIDDLKKLSSPYLDGTIDLKKYGGALWELSRGCPFKCSYCYESKGEKIIRHFPLERLEKELELFEKEKISQVFVLDPTYNANKSHALSILSMISEKAPGIFFYFEARAEFIDRDLSKAFSKIKCALQIGLQSSSPDVLRLVNRSLDKKKFSKNISYLNEEQVVFGLDLIYGLPGDNLEGFRKSVDYAISLYPNNLETFRLSVLPGTDLFDNADKLKITFQNEPPYNVVFTDKFSKTDLMISENLSHSINVFYNHGRAVPWFNSLCFFLNKKASSFFDDFYLWFKNKSRISESIEKFDFSCRNHREIENVQLSFLGDYLRNRNVRLNEQKAIFSIVKANGAMSRVGSDCNEETVILDFHPDDIFSEYSLDIRFFSKNIKPHKNKARFFMSKNGICWKVSKN